MRRKTIVRVEFSADELDQLEEFAKSKGEKPAGWIRKAAMAQLPTEYKKSAGETALSRMEETINEEFVPENVLPIAPPVEVIVRAPLPAPVQEELPHAEVKNHPCMLLTAGVPPGFGPLDARGTCLHTGQRGRPCHYPAMVAKECPKFVPKRPR